MSFYSGTLLTITFVLFVTPASCYVVYDPQSKVLIEALPVTNPTNVTNSTSSAHHAAADSQLVSQLGRQDGDALSNVGSIVTGVLGGGLGSIFQGSSNFIPDNGVKQEVDFVLNNVAPPLETVLKYGFQGFQQYFTQTTVSPTLNATQNSKQQIWLQPVTHENGTVLQYIPIFLPAMRPVQQVPVKAPTAQTEGEGDEDDQLRVLGTEEQGENKNLGTVGDSVLQYSQIRSVS